MSLTCSADLMSLFGAKWSGTRAIRSRSKTSATARSRTARMAIGLVTSLPSARSTLARISSPGSTFSFPACFARIFSVSVMPIDGLPFVRRYPVPLPDRPDDFPDRPGDDVQRGEQEDHDLGLRREQERQEDEHDQGVEGAAAERLQVLEAGELHRAHHEEREHVDRQEDGHVLEAPRAPEIVVQEDRRRDEGRR